MLVPEVAQSQHGAFSRRQARASGFTAYVITNRLRDGVWTEVFANAFTLAGVPRTPEVRAMGATLVTGGVASHWTAAALHGFGDLARHLAPEATEVTTTQRVHAEVVGVLAHRHRLGRADVTTSRGIPITTRPRTVLDLMSAAPRGDAARIMFRALQQRWLTRADLSAAGEQRRGMHGITMIRELAELTGTNAHSVAESRLHDVLREVPGLAWRANVELRLPTRRSVVDVLVSERIVVEVDGFAFHSSADEFQRDRERQNALVNAGYVVLRFTWLDLVERPGYVVSSILRELRQPAA